MRLRAANDPVRSVLGSMSGTRTCNLASGCVCLQENQLPSYSMRASICVGARIYRLLAVPLPFRAPLVLPVFLEPEHIPRNRARTQARSGISCRNWRHQATPPSAPCCGGRWSWGTLSLTRAMTCRALMCSERLVRLFVFSAALFLPALPSSLLLPFHP